MSSEQLLVISPEVESTEKEIQRSKCEQEMLELSTNLTAFSSFSSSFTSSASNSSSLGYCMPNFDGRLCWLTAQAGTEFTVPCPQFINGFINDTDEKYTVIRRCNQQGSWEWLPDHDYTFCGELMLQWNSVLTWLLGHLDTVAWIYTIGYCICLGPLVASVFVLLAFRRLRCPRNYIHVNFFASVIFQFITSLVKDILQPGRWVVPGEPNPDLAKLLGCRAIYVASYYFSSATCAWTFVEGLYLYILMFSTSVVEQNIWKNLMALGWGAPLIFVLSWCVCRYFVDNSDCWSSHYQNSYVFYVLKLPNVGMISCTFFFFIRIFITLLHKLRADIDSRRPSGIATRMVKSTLALIVLFGVPYITFAFMPDNEIPFTRLNLIKWHKALVVKLYFEFSFQVIQALALVAVFAFGNTEVQDELSYLVSRLRHAALGGELPQRSSQMRPRTSTGTSRYHLNNNTDLTTTNNENATEEAVLLSSKSETATKLSGNGNGNSSDCEQNLNNNTIAIEETTTL